MAKKGYIMATTHYDKLEENRNWMQEYGCVRVVEENDTDKKSRPLWKQLMIALKRNDELMISQFSNAIRGTYELAMFMEFCRVKVIWVISIHDRTVSNYRNKNLRVLLMQAVFTAAVRCSAYRTSMVAN